jgi:LPXTG-motif cell wall-anchored protein
MRTTEKMKGDIIMGKVIVVAIAALVAGAVAFLVKKKKDNYTTGI